MFVIMFMIDDFGLIGANFFGIGFGGNFGFVVGFDFGFRFLGIMRTVGNRDTEIIGVDFAERQETVAIAAIFDKGRLQRRFDANDFGKIDIAFELLFACTFEVEIFEAAFADNCYTSFFRMRRIH